MIQFLRDRECASRSREPLVWIARVPQRPRHITRGHTLNADADVYGRAGNPAHGQDLLKVLACCLKIAQPKGSRRKAQVGGRQAAWAIGIPGEGEELLANFETFPIARSELVVSRQAR